MQRVDDNPRMMLTTLARLRDTHGDSEEYSALPNDGMLPSPTSSTGTPVFVSNTPRSDTPPSNNSWIAVTPSSDDEQPRRVDKFEMNSDLALAVEGLRIHEHEESFPSEGEEEDEDISVPPSEDSSFEEEVNDEFGESSDEETILAPRTLASLPQPLSDEALRASLSTLLRSKDATTAFIEEFPSPRRMTAQGPLGIESLSLVNPEDFAIRTSQITSRASSHKSRSKKSKSRSPRSLSKSRSKDNAAQMYALWTAAITAGFLVGFGAGYAWKEYLAGSGDEVRRVGCTWCGEGKR